MLGRLLRLPLRAIPNGAVLPILAGPSRGMKWIAVSGPSSNLPGVKSICILIHSGDWNYSIRPVN
jgi:hypothetical protein